GAAGCAPAMTTRFVASLAFANRTRRSDESRWASMSCSRLDLRLQPAATATRIMTAQPRALVLARSAAVQRSVTPTMAALYDRPRRGPSICAGQPMTIRSAATGRIEPFTELKWESSGQYARPLDHEPAAHLDA